MAALRPVGAQEPFRAASDFSRLYVGAVEPQYQKSLWHDMPYYKGSTDMYKGRISYHGVVYDDVQLRFDQLKQRVVVLPPGGRAVCLPDQAFVDWFEMDGHRYVHDKADSSRYAALLCDGSSNGIRLYHSEWKIFDRENSFDGKKYLKTLTTEEQYTLVTPDGAMHRVKRAKDVARLFPEQKKQLRQFAKKNRLSFSKGEREKSLTVLVESLECRTESVEFLPCKRPSAERATAIPSAEKLQSGERFSEMDTAAAISTLYTLDSQLIPGIPVLDNDTAAMAMTSSTTKTYVVPGVKKAKVSVSDDQELDELVVIGGRQSAVDNMMMGSEKFKPQLLKNIPSALGESDVMKIMLTLPGVTTVGEASSGYNVRGGATDQNLILFNGGTVYNPSHLFGLFTSFNSDAVEDVELFKSSIPVEYGGRISSVLKVTSKAGSPPTNGGLASRQGAMACRTFA